MNSFYKDKIAIIDYRAVASLTLGVGEDKENFLQVQFIAGAVLRIDGDQRAAFTTGYTEYLENRGKPLRILKGGKESD